MLAGGEVVQEEGTFDAKEAPIMPARKIRTDRESRAKRAVQWEWAPFTNSARKDGLARVLHHWQKKGVEFAEYPYARFNVDLERITYTDEEYGRLLKDPSWTKHDTDTLVNLCWRLGLRWPVILDRYAPVPRRPLEQLQARYYFCAHALSRDRYKRSRGNRLEAEGGVPKYVDNSATLGISSRTRDFDAGYEEKRRRQLHVAFCRTRAEEAEEKALREELKTVELESRRLKRAARGQGPEPERRGRALDPRAALAHAATALQPKRPTPGQPFLQSGRLRAPDSSTAGLSKGMLTKLALVLEELGVAPRPLPTKLVCDAYDALRRDIVALLSLQKIATTKEAELKAMRRAHEEKHRAARAAQSQKRKAQPVQPVHAHATRQAAPERQPDPYARSAQYQTKRARK